MQPDQNAASPEPPVTVPSVPDDALRGAEIVEVIRVDFLRGSGDVRRLGEMDRCRTVTRYFSRGGDLLAEHDPHLLDTLRHRVEFFEGLVENYKRTRDEKQATHENLRRQHDESVAREAETARRLAIAMRAIVHMRAAKKRKRK